MRTLFCGILILIFSSCFPVEAQQSKRQSGQDPSDPFYQHIKSLSNADKIEILAVGYIPIEKLREVDCKDPKNLCHPPYGIAVKILARTIIVGKAAESVTALWRQLEPGNSMGCFAPGYVMRFYSKERLILETEVCFHCCNVSLPNYGLAGVCGNGKAISRFEKMIMSILPYPRAREGNK